MTHKLRIEDLKRNIEGWNMRIMQSEIDIYLLNKELEHNKKIMRSLSDELTELILKEQEETSHK